MFPNGDRRAGLESVEQKEAEKNRLEKQNDCLFPIILQFFFYFSGRHRVWQRRPVGFARLSQACAETVRMSLRRLPASCCSTLSAAHVIFPHLEIYICSSSTALHNLWEDPYGMLVVFAQQIISNCQLIYSRAKLIDIRYFDAIARQWKIIQFARFCGPSIEMLFHSAQLWIILLRMILAIIWLNIQQSSLTSRRADDAESETRSNKPCRRRVFFSLCACIYK